jgi:hypothetical protein
MAKPKVKRDSRKLMISFWDEGPEGDDSGGGGFEILELILLLIIGIFIDKNTVTIDTSSSTLAYQKKKILRKRRVEKYAFDQINRLSLHQSKRKGFLEATLDDSKQLRLLPRIKKRKLKRLSEEISKMLGKSLDFVELATK